jgi:hypothetical protein
VDGAEGLETGEGSLETSCETVASGADNRREVDSICEVTGCNECWR